MISAVTCHCGRACERMYAFTYSFILITSSRSCFRFWWSLHTYIHTYIHTYMRSCLRFWWSLQLRVTTVMCMYVTVDAHTDICVYVCAFSHTYAHTYKHTHIICAGWFRTCVPRGAKLAGIFPFSWRHNWCLRYVWKVCVCLSVCLSVCLCIQDISQIPYVCIYVLYACIYVMYV